MESLAARRRHRQPRASLDQVGDEARRRGDDALEVVQQKQELAIAETSCERVGRRLAGLLAEAECPDDDGRHGERVVDRGERLDEERAVRVHDGATVRASLDRQARLADPARPGQRQHRSRAESLDDVPALFATTDDGVRESGGSPSRCASSGGKSGRVSRRAGTAAPAGDALQAVVAEVAHLDALAGEVLVAWESTTWPPCAAAQMRATREVDTDVVLARSQLRLAGVDADPNEHRPLRPLVLGERALRSRGRVQSLPSTIERDEKRVTLGVDLAAAVRGECSRSRRRCAASDSS